MTQVQFAEGFYCSCGAALKDSPLLQGVPNGADAAVRWVRATARKTAFVWAGASAPCPDKCDAGFLLKLKPRQFHPRPSPLICAYYAAGILTQNTVFFPSCDTCDGSDSKSNPRSLPLFSRHSRHCCHTRCERNFPRLAGGYSFEKHH